MILGLAAATFLSMLADLALERWEWRQVERRVRVRNQIESIPTMTADEYETLRLGP